MSAKHTPGPWDSSTYEVEANDGTLICNMSGWKSPEASKANARLIAAAPELLEALKNIYDLLEDGHWQETKRRIFELIAKAEGQS
jgi:hypothetical protein